MQLALFQYQVCNWVAKFATKIFYCNKNILLQLNFNFHVKFHKKNKKNIIGMLKIGITLKIQREIEIRKGKNKCSSKKGPGKHNSRNKINIFFKNKTKLLISNSHWMRHQQDYPLMAPKWILHATGTLNSALQFSYSVTIFSKPQTFHFQLLMNLLMPWHVQKIFLFFWPSTTYPVGRVHLPIHGYASHAANYVAK